MAQASLPRRSIFLFLDAGIPLVGGLGGSPHTNRKISLSPQVPQCFAPKILILLFSYSIWPICSNCAPTSRSQLEEWKRLKNLRKKQEFRQKPEYFHL